MYVATNAKSEMLTYISKVAWLFKIITIVGMRYWMKKEMYKIKIKEIIQTCQNHFVESAALRRSKRRAALFRILTEYTIPVLIMRHSKQKNRKILKNRFFLSVSLVVVVGWDGGDGWRGRAVRRERYPFVGLRTRPGPNFKIGPGPGPNFESR